MVAFLMAVIGALRPVLRSRVSLVAENLALRQQLAILRRQLRIAPRSPWQYGFAERLVGTFRREPTDHLIVLNKRHLVRCIREYARFYNSDRPHMSLSGDAPAGREVEPPDRGNVIVLPRVGGLHYRYTRRAA